jgi:uncharacterized protein (UPF0276 family)
MPQPSVGLNIQSSDDFRIASLPLFESDSVDVLEYSFDTGWSGEPEWLSDLVDHYSDTGRLLGHGVHFSALSAPSHQSDMLQHRWLDNLKRECQRRRYVHISEHFGFMTTTSFHDSAPLPVPRSTQTCELGRDRLLALRNIANVPVGLENLAFAFGRQDVREQGVFLDDMLAPGDDFLLLDLHNIFCQIHNFGIDADALLDCYPLHRVRELHVSGGSWTPFESGAFRRDTHDGAVPEDVFRLVSRALQRCPNVTAVIFERLGGTMPCDKDRESFQEDYRRLRNLVQTFKPEIQRKNMPALGRPPVTPGQTNDELEKFQCALLELLSEPVDAATKLERLKSELPFEPYRAYVQSFDARSIAVASELVNKWGRRY